MLAGLTELMEVFRDSCEATPGPSQPHVPEALCRLSPPQQAPSWPPGPLSQAIVCVLQVPTELLQLPGCSLLLTPHLLPALPLEQVAFQPLRGAVGQVVALGRCHAAQGQQTETATPGHCPPCFGLTPSQCPSLPWSLSQDLALLLAGKHLESHQNKLFVVLQEH